MLILRAALGTTSLIQGAAWLTNPGSAVTLSIGVAALIGGVALLLGALTPIASALVGVGDTCIAFSVMRAPAPNFLNAPLSAVFVAIVAAAIVFLGPGAFSLDSRFFGRREIIIPPVHRSQEDSR